MTTRGIPFVYYGSEQEFDGSDDPLNREMMVILDKNTDNYQIIKKVNSIRKKH